MEVQTVDVTDIPSKKCSRCKMTKNVSEFGKNNAAKDKLNYHCKECDNKASNIQREKIKVHGRPNKRTVETKYCKGCRVVKTANEYFHCSMSSDGLQYRCKVCSVAVYKETRQQHKAFWDQDAPKRCVTGKKMCSYCENEKPIVDFNWDSSRKDGYNSVCKSCCSAISIKTAEKHKRKWAMTEINREGVKKCCKCNQYHPKVNFHTDTTKPDGLNGKCKSCVKEQRDAGSIFIKELIKQKGPCVHCGTDDLDVLELDHLNPNEKEDEVANMVLRSKEVIMTEVEKTRVLCCFCHRVVSSKQRGISKKPCEVRRIQFNRDMKDRIGKCQQCSREIDKTDNHQYCAFDWDHIDPSQKVDGIANVIKNYTPLDEVAAEIAKCQLLCANCHLKRTKQQKKDGVIS